MYITHSEELILIQSHVLLHSGKACDQALLLSVNRLRQEGEGRGAGRTWMIRCCVSLAVSNMSNVIGI